MEQLKRNQHIVTVYNKFWKELYIIAFRRLKNEENVEDILQELFLTLLEGNFDFKNELSTRSLLHTLLKNRIIDFFRRELLKISLEKQTPLESEISLISSDTQLLHQELETVVMREINNLPKKMKEIFLLSREEMLSNDEIATRLSISNKTVRNQLSSALKRINVTVQNYSSGELEPASLNIVITLGVLLLRCY